MNKRSLAGTSFGRGDSKKRIVREMDTGRERNDSRNGSDVCTEWAKTSFTQRKNTEKRQVVCVRISLRRLSLK